MTLDPLRTESVQSSLFENFKSQLLKNPFGFSEHEAVEKTQQYVSLPSREHSPHMTGGAVDLTIVEFRHEASWKEYQRLTSKLKSAKVDRLSDENVHRLETQRHFLLHHATRTLDMGVVFDEVTLDDKGRDKTALRYFELKLAEDGIESFSAVDMEALRNRRLLYQVLAAAGFSMYPGEPWHADYGNKFWAQQTGNKAIYGYIDLSPENRAHEEKRLALMKIDHLVHQAPDLNNIFSGLMKTAFENSEFRLFSHNHPRARRISPARGDGMWGQVMHHPDTKPRGDSGRTH